MDDLISVLSGDAPDVAPRLLGCVLRVGECSGRIVETEAYRGADDGASHARMGPTARNAPMFGPAGMLYVYFTYGMHWCANVVTGPVGVGQAVLIRAVEPINGIEAMRARRGRVRREADLSNGPAKLCVALGIDGSANNTSLTTGLVRLELADPVEPGAISTGPRIGISAATELPWRYWLRGNQWVSR